MGEQFSRKIDAPAYMAAAIAIHAEMMHRLTKRGQMSMVEWGELMEDVGNRYLDIAEHIRDVIILSRSVDPVEHQLLSGQKSAPKRLAKRRPG